MTDLPLISSTLSNTLGNHTARDVMPLLFSHITWSLCWLAFWLHARQQYFKRPQPATLITGAVVVAVGLIAFWCPIPGMSANLAGFFKGLMYAPSIGLILVGLSVIRSHSAKIKSCPTCPIRACAQNGYLDRYAFWPWIILLVIPFYPTALGWGLWDPYRWGYLPSFTLAVAALNVVLWLISTRIHQIKMLAIWLTLSLAAQQLSLYESTNLWDILLDPFVSIWSLCLGVKTGYRRLRGKEPFAAALRQPSA